MFESVLRRTSSQQLHLKVSQSIRVWANEQDVAPLEAAGQLLGPCHSLGHMSVAEVCVQLEGARTSSRTDAVLCDSTKEVMMYWRNRKPCVERNVVYPGRGECCCCLLKNASTLSQAYLICMFWTTWRTESSRTRHPQARRTCAIQDSTTQENLSLPCLMAGDRRRRLTPGSNIQRRRSQGGSLA